MKKENKLETANKIPARSEISDKDKWDLSRLYKNDSEWEKGLDELKSEIEKIASFKGKLGSSAEKLEEFLLFLNELGLLEERLGYYSNLKLSEDGGDGKNQERFSKFVTAATKGEAETSFMNPELQAIPDEEMKKLLDDERIKPFSIMLNKILRYKPHILSDSEEKLLAMQSEANQTARKAFSSLTDVDMEFGTVKTEEGDIPLSQSSYSSFMINPDREIRKTAYDQFLGEFDKHKNTIAALYAGSVHLDLYSSRVRKFPSCREASLFADKVDIDVYDNLIKTVHDNLHVLHKYYEIRRKALSVDRLRLYDVYVPIVKDIKVKHSYEEAVDVIEKALSPLGEEYCRTLTAGLKGGWVDKYENKGKRSGAFSAGSYVGDPYILISYKDDVLRNVFTLAHEGGHSMHSWYSVRNNPFQHYDYTIFEAEVASTFNEQLLAKYLIDNAENDEMKKYLINKQLDDIIATIFRQTMFAEYELITHTMAENGVPLTVDSLRSEYRKLLEKYFGKDVALEDLSDLEGLRIPHFYRAFYVYKYATGLSAAFALSERVLSGGKKERDDYLSFLKSGGSRFPLESLKLAGVDMSRPEPVENAMKKFESLVNELNKF